MTPAEQEKKIVDELSILPDVFERMTFLLESDKRRPGLPEEAKTDDLLVQGCQAMVWITAKKDNGAWKFESDSDAPIVRALAGALCRIFSGSDSKTIASFEPTFLDTLQIRSQLTPTRQNGFERMVERIKESSR